MSDSGFALLFVPSPAGIEMVLMFRKDRGALNFAGERLHVLDNWGGGTHY